MKLLELSPRFYVSAQISVPDVGIAAAQGVRTIICNRPDQEKPVHPISGDLATAAQEAGIDFLHMPVLPGGITDEDVENFSVVYKKSKEPILAYCGSGMRSTSLWALIEVDSLAIDVILETAAKVGQDLTAIRPRLEASAGRG